MKYWKQRKKQIPRSWPLLFSTWGIYLLDPNQEVSFPKKEWNKMQVFFVTHGILGLYLPQVPNSMDADFQVQ